MATHPHQSLPQSCDDWSDLKAAYRFLSNPRVTPDAIQGPHRQWTRKQCARHTRVLVLQDTTELDFTARKKMRGLGPVGDGHGRGLLQHTALAVTSKRKVLGILHQQWSLRPTPPEGETRRERLARPKKSDCWPQTVAAVGASPAGTRFIHVCDRESDGFEFFHACQNHGCGFLIRAQHDRCVNGSSDKLWAHMAGQPVMAKRSLDLSANPGREARTAQLEVRCAQVTLAPPKQDPRFTAPLTVGAVYVTEPRVPQDAEPIEWMLLTTESLATADDAIARIDEYTARWLIEEFHKAEKTGCRLEASQLDDAADVQRLSAMVAVVAVRLLILRELAQGAIQGGTPADDPRALRQAVPWLWIVVVARADKRKPLDPTALTPREFWLRIARRGGYIGRRSDGPPGWSTIWQGWYEFTIMFRCAEFMVDAPIPPEPSCSTCG